MYTSYFRLELSEQSLNLGRINLSSIGILFPMKNLCDAYSSSFVNVHSCMFDVLFNCCQTAVGHAYPTLSNANLIYQARLQYDILWTLELLKQYAEMLDRKSLQELELFGIVDYTTFSKHVLQHIEMLEKGLVHHLKCLMVNWTPFWNHTMDKLTISSK